MAEAIIVDAVRTARGKRKGSLAGVHPVDLLARTLRGALERANLAAKDMGDVIAGGVEHMTRVPMGSDALGGEGPLSPDLSAHWPNLVPQGLSAEMIASKWGYSREKLDEYAVHSQQKAANAIEKGYFAKEILPFAIAEGRAFDHDEHARPGTTMETLAKLKPSFKED